MKIHYKIIKKIPLDSQIIVRYFTDVVTEQYLATETDQHGEITRSRADYAIQIPLSSEDSIEEIIKKSCPYQSLEIEEKKILTAAGTVHKEIAENMDKIEKVPVGKIKTMEFPSTLEKTEEELISDRLKKINIDADILTYSVHGARATIYDNMYAAALAYKNAGYAGDVSPYLADLIGTNASPESVVDTIIKKHEDAENTIIDINKNRLLAKAGVREGKDKALNIWNKYVIKTKSKIGD